MSAENAATARRWFEEVWNQRRGDLIDELLCEESVCHGEHGPIVGREGFRERVHGPFLAAIPDLHFDVEGLVCEGDEAVVRWVARGTHSGDGLGFPPSGQPVEVRGMTWMRFRDGRMAEGWDRWNFHETVGTLKAASDALAAGRG